MNNTHITYGKYCSLEKDTKKTIVRIRLDKCAQNTLSIIGLKVNTLRRTYVIVYRERESSLWTLATLAPQHQFQILKWQSSCFASQPNDQKNMWSSKCPQWGHTLVTFEKKANIYVLCKVCGTIVGTSNSTTNYDHCIESGKCLIRVAIVKQEDCHFKFLDFGVEMQKLQKSKVEILYFFERSERSSQLYWLLNLDRCLYLEHIVQLHQNTCFSNVCS